VVSWLSKLPGKRVFFITNSSGRTRAEYAEKIRKFGFTEVKPEQVYSSSYTTARYLGQNTAIKKVQVLG
jgi:ribonucleotide monophosphatase NagD (HAD superfamily)